MEAPRFQGIHTFMTIHDSVRSARVHVVGGLSDAVVRATSRSGVVRLMKVLGVSCAAPGVPLPAMVRSFDQFSVRRAWRLAEHGTLAVMLAELTVGASADSIIWCARAARAIETTRPFLILIAGASYRTLTFACYAPDGQLRHLTVETASPLASDLDILRDMTARANEPGVSLALRYAAALDSSAAGARFFSEVRIQRDRISGAWSGLAADMKPERDQLALLLLCRLLFLYFLQKQGHLCGDPSYMRTIVRAWQRDGDEGSTLYHAVLSPLFFGALNTRPEHRAEPARLLGPLPYLNGGLFERHAIELRHSALDLPDTVALGVFSDLLDRFRFTASDAAHSVASPLHGTHVDPEMLGRVFENLMSADRRGDTGSFYTPPRIVRRLTADVMAGHLARTTSVSVSAVDDLIHQGSASGLSESGRACVAQRLREVRVLDPACGSGAFLLGALSGLSAARIGLGEDEVCVRRDVVARCLHGVDILDDAALLCSLRLWLALADTSTTVPPPLPNLDRRIRQGDALLDPLELLDTADATEDGRARRDPAVQRALGSLASLSLRYVEADPIERSRLRAAFGRAERAVADAWLGALRVRIEYAGRDAQARSAGRDLWGAATTSARIALSDMQRLQKRLTEVATIERDLADSAALPFFSFRVHFADAEQFDIILSNPPWVRAHRWPAAVGAAVRQRYEVCRTGTSGGGQVDLAMLFLERSLSLLAPAGTLGMLLPAKLMRSLYAGSARALLLRETRIASVEDHSLDQRAVFRADAFTMSLVAHKGTDEAARCPVHIRMLRRNSPPLDFLQDAHDLPLDRSDPASPWLIAPPRVLAVFRSMQCAGPMISQIPELCVRRGVVTGANDVLIAREFRHVLGGLTHIKTEGYFRARKRSYSTAEARRFAGYVETSALRPLLRGSDVRAWTFEPSSRLLWSAGNEGGRGRAPRLESYLRRHATALGARTGIRVSAETGRLMRVSRSTLGHKVVWKDIADNLLAAAVPDSIRADGSSDVPVVPLNTLYFVAVPDSDTAMLLSAYLNSLPMRAFARAAAERAKDARFRFFAWTIGSLPLPRTWRDTDVATLIDIAREAHADGGLARVRQLRLDAIVARAFGLGDDDMNALLAFDNWLCGAP